MSQRLSLLIRRFWTPVGTTADSADGFSIDDHDWYRQIARPETKPLTDFADVPCLFLLGEPGLGKSTAIRQEVTRLHEELPTGEQVHLLDLAEISSDEGLDTAFEHDVIAAWVQDDSVLHLFLDSYDECLRRYPTLQPRFLARLRNLPRKRLRLRVACRAGEFPGHLPAAVQELWSANGQEHDAVRILQLEPLTRAAVRTWAQAEEVDAKAFLDAVHRHNALSFAVRPITLGSLITQYKQARFPQTEVELFRASCRALCDEPNPDRERHAVLTGDQRLAVAERLAALMTLAGKDVIWLGSAQQTPDGALPLDALVGGDEVVEDIRFAVGRDQAREVVEACALFAVHDAHLVRWSQQVYREFLAASYFARRLTDRMNSVQFFEHQGRPGFVQRFVAPQVAEPAAWLAAMDENFAQWMAEHAPGVLLRGRHYIFPSIRPTLVAWWLQQEAQGYSVGVPWSAEQKATLDHPNLATQLRQILSDRNAGEGGRSLACDIAWACGLVEMEGLLTEVALDSHEPLRLRWRAVAALGEIGSDGAKQRIVPLLTEIDGESGMAHRLRGQVLATAWPTHLSTAEALDYLAAHQHSSGDEYSTTFEHRFTRRLTPEHLVEALGWITERAAQPDGPHEHLIGEVFDAAARAIEDGAVRNALSRAIVARLREHYYVIAMGESQFLGALAKHDEEVRLRLVDDLVALLRASDEIRRTLDRFVVSLNLSYGSVVARTLAADAVAGPYWVQVLRADPRTWSDPACLEVLRSAQAGAPDGSEAKTRLAALVGDVVAWNVQPTESYGVEGTAESARATRTREEQVSQLLLVARVNLPQAWYDLCRTLNLDEESQTWTLDYVLSGTPGWHEASPDRRQEILTVAFRFLRKCPTRYPQYRLDDAFTVSGYQAAGLLMDAAPFMLDDLSAPEWVYWLPGLVTSGHWEASPSRLQGLVETAYRRYPGDLRETVRELLGTDAVSPYAQDPLEAFDPCWDEDFATVLLAALTEDELAPHVRRAVLTALIRHADQRAIELALTWTQHRDGEHDRAVDAARCLLLNGDAASIGRAVAILEADHSLARETLLAVAPVADGVREFPSVDLPEWVLADLYLLVADLFSPAEDPEVRPGVMREVGVREMVANGRDRLVWRLAGGGTWRALAELERIIAHRPDLARPREAWTDAEQTTLRRSWVALVRPRDVLDVVADQQRRIIPSADQLLDLVVESLGRLQEDLLQRGAVADLWSEWSDDRRMRYRPKGELSFSDYIKRFLDRDLRQYTVAANREVENKRGNETDILVQYIDRDSGGREVRRLAVVIEVKGCWHSDLLTAMETQLASRYLTGSEAERGVYLVGWFNCESWDPEDHRRGKPTGYTLQTLREELTQQATSMTNEHRRIEAVVLDAALPV